MAELQSREITKVDLRENFIATQSIVIQAFGRVGNYFYTNHDNMDVILQQLEKNKLEQKRKTVVYACNR